MKIHYLSYQQQMNIIKDLYNINDGVEALARLENEYGIKIKRLGLKPTLRKFARKLDKTKFFNYDIEKAIKRHSGHEIDLQKL